MFVGMNIIMNNCRPFLTESLWQLLPRPSDAPASIMVSPWPLLSVGRGKDVAEPTLPQDEQAEQQFASFQALVRAIRNARSQYNVDVGRKIAVILKIEKPGFRKAMLEEAAVGLLVLSCLVLSDLNRISNAILT